jgi:hypothetical protein
VITEILEALGSWDITLDQATPRSTIDQLGYFGHLVIVDGPVDVEATGEALLDVARYVGVLRERDADARKFAGSGLVYWLGDEDDKGDLIEAELVLTSKTLAQAVTAILPAAAPAGTIYPQPDPAQRYTGSHRYQTRRKALSIVCDAFGVEFRVNTDGTVDVGTRAQLYQGVPRTDGRPTPVIARQTGADIDLVAIEGKLSAKGAVYDYSTRVVLLGQTTDAGQFATGSRNAPSVPYVDLHGNPVKSTRLISESTETVGSVDARSQLALNRFNRETRTLQLQVEDYVTEGTARVGDDCYVYDPDTGIFDTATQLSFRGDTIFPDVIRVSGVTWPVTQGMTVAFRTGSGVWLDLTPFVTWETGGGQVTIGDLPASLSRPGDDPISLRVDAARSTTSTVQPNPPTGLTLTSYTVADPRTGLSSGRITVDWTAPTTNVDSSVPPNVAYYVTQWKWTSRAQWESTYTDGTDVDVAAVIDLDYDVRVAAVSAAGVQSTWTTGTVHVARDTIGPPAPADPTVDGDAWAGQLRVAWSGFTAAAARMPADTNRVDVHVGATAGFVHSADTLHSSLTPFGSGVDLVETPPGTTRYIKLVAVDNTGNESTPSATVPGTARAVRDGDMLSMSVSKLIAGTISSTIVVADRLTTALTGSRRELNSVGFQAWDASNNLLVSLDGVNNLLTGIFQTALSGRRIVMGAAGAVGNIEFIAPDGTKTFVRAWTESAGVEAIQFGVAGAGGDVNLPNTLWNRINYNNDSGGYSSYRANRHEFMIGDSNGVLNDGDRGFFHVFQVATTAGTGGIERMLIDSASGAFKLRGSADTQLFESSDVRFQVLGTSQSTTPRLEMTNSDGYLIHGSNQANGYQEYTANGQTTLSMASTNGHILIKPNGSNDPDISPLIQLNTEDGAALAWRTLFDGTNQWLEAVVFTQAAYASVRGASFTSVSDERTKTDIVNADLDALAEVRGARVVNFRRKPLPMRRQRRQEDGRTIDVDEVDDGYVPPTQPLELGLTAQTAPAAIVRPMANGLYGIDLGAQGALNMRAIQQLADAVDEALDRLNALDRKGGRTK